MSEQEHAVGIEAVPVEQAGEQEPQAAAVPLSPEAIDEMLRELERTASLNVVKQALQQELDTLAKAKVIGRIAHLGGLDEHPKTIGNTADRAAGRIEVLKALWANLEAGELLTMPSGLDVVEMDGRRKR